MHEQGGVWTNSPAYSQCYGTTRKLAGAGSTLPPCAPNSKAPMSGLVPLHGRCNPAPLAYEQAGEKEIDVAVMAVIVTCPQPWIWIVSAAASR